MASYCIVNPNPYYFVVLKNLDMSYTLSRFYLKKPSLPLTPSFVYLFRIRDLQIFKINPYQLRSLFIIKTNQNKTLSIFLFPPRGIVWNFLFIFFSNYFHVKREKIFPLFSFTFKYKKIDNQMQ